MQTATYYLITKKPIYLFAMSYLNYIIIKSADFVNRNITNYFIFCRKFGLISN